jgi:hypothetical protein
MSLLIVEKRNEQVLLPRFLPVPIQRLSGEREEFFFQLSGFLFLGFPLLGECRSGTVDQNHGPESEPQGRDNSRLFVHVSLSFWLG